MRIGHISTGGNFSNYLILIVGAGLSLVGYGLVWLYKYEDPFLRKSGTLIKLHNQYARP